MIAVYSEKHRINAPKQELHNGMVAPPFEVPGQAEIILNELKARETFDILPPESFPIEYIENVHDTGYLQLLEKAGQEWRNPAMPSGISPRITRSGIPVLFVIEGGYAVEDIGVNVCNCLEGFSCAKV